VTSHIGSPDSPICLSTSEQTSQRDEQDPIRRIYETSNGMIQSKVSTYSSLGTTHGSCLELVTLSQDSRQFLHAKQRNLIVFSTSTLLILSRPLGKKFILQWASKYKSHLDQY
jgi:hypothetical protein